MLTLTSFTSCSSEIRSRTGETAWHGPHHSAQKSDDHFAVGLQHLGLERVGRCSSCQLVPFVLVPCTRSNVKQGAILPESYDRTHVYPSSGQTRSSQHRAGDPRPLGAGSDLRAAAGTGTRGGPHWSFIDGPVTANKPLAIHTTWGRTLKDVCQRYKSATRVSTSATRTASTARASGSRSASSAELGLNSKPEIAEYGLEEFRAQVPRARCPVIRGADARIEAPRAVDGLGQRLLHVQRHEHRVHLEVPEDRQRPRLALQGPPVDRVVPALRHLVVAARAEPVRRLPGPALTRLSTFVSR